MYTSKLVGNLIRSSFNIISFRSHKAANLAKDLEQAQLRGQTSRKVYIKNYLNQLMKMDTELEKVLAPLRNDVKIQGDIVRDLKAKLAPQADIEAAVRTLKEKKRILEAKEASLVPKDSFVDRSRLEDTLKRRFFFDTSFSIYGGVSGLYDYGPNGVAIKKNILRLWESHFVLEEDLLEIEASQLTPEPVLKASGHVDRFADLMIKDVKTGDCYRLDHLIKGHLEKLSSSKDCSSERKLEINNILARLDGLTEKEMDQLVRRFNMKAPATGNDLSEPVQFNLMFSTHIGPTGLIKSFLRPETAQGIFVNFKRLYEANQGKLPFGVAQIGKSFRNEISPRGGLVRMREFTMAEIEYFVDPKDKSHKKFDSIKELKPSLYSASDQMSGQSARQTTLSEAVASGTIANQVLGYYIGRIYQFMVLIGIDPQRIRFRQHMSNEMAHYATDCWDCECLTSVGWLECIGCADRSCYDLSQHAQATNVKLSASRPLKEPKLVDLIECIPQKAILGKVLKGDSKRVIDKLSTASSSDISLLAQELESGVAKLTIGDDTFELTKDMVEIKKTRKNISVEEIVPNVIEPSFGIDRIMYTLLEHNYKIREDNSLRTYFTFPAVVAPIKCSILPLSNTPELTEFVVSICKNLKEKGVRSKIDSSGESIGKKYARTDEIGIPFAITIDFDTSSKKSVTLRDCASLDQVRVPLESIAQVISDLSCGAITWDQVASSFEKFLGQENA